MPSIVFQQSSIPGNSETVIFNYTNTSGSSVSLLNLGGSSDVRSEMLIKIDGVEKKKVRETSPNPNIDIPFYRLLLPNASSITVDATHYESFNGEFSIDLIFE